MTEIRIDNTGNGCNWLYGENELWKDCVCENFDEHVVLIGNIECCGCEKAEWYKNAKQILKDIDCYDEYPIDLPKSVNAKLKELYKKCECTDDIVFDALRLLYPEDKFETGIIQGYNQEEIVEYIIKGDVDTKLLELYYFDKISDVDIVNGDKHIGDVITDDELWKAEQDGLKEYMKKKYNIPEDEELHIFKADGYIQVLNWKEIV